MPVYPGDSLVNIDTPVALANGDAANVSRLRLGAHTGTHVDAPPIDPGPGMPLPDRLLPARMIKRRSSSSTSDLSLGVALAKYLFRRNCHRFPLARNVKDLNMIPGHR